MELSTGGLLSGANDDFSDISGFHADVARSPA